MWTQQHGTSQIDQANGVAIDSSGNIYVTGMSTGALDGTSTGSPGLFVIKYNSNGTRQ